MNRAKRKHLIECVEAARMRDWHLVPSLSGPPQWASKTGSEIVADMLAMFERRMPVVDEALLERYRQMSCALTPLHRSFIIPEDI